MRNTAYLSAILTVGLFSSAFAETKFHCRQTDGQERELIFSFDPSNGFSFNNGPWTKPIFLGPMVTVENSLALKFGDEAAIKKSATVSTSETLQALDYFEGKGISNKAGVIDDWLTMSGLELVYRNTFYEIELDTLLVTIHEVVTRDKIAHEKRTYQCAVASDAFK